MSTAFRKDDIRCNPYGNPTIHTSPIIIIFTLTILLVFFITITDIHQWGLLMDDGPGFLIIEKMGGRRRMVYVVIQITIEASSEVYLYL